MHKGTPVYGVTPAIGPVPAIYVSLPHASPGFRVARRLRERYLNCRANPLPRCEVSIRADAESERNETSVGGRMSTWAKRLKLGAATAGSILGAGALAIAGAGTAGAATPPTLGFHPATTALTLPAGCTDQDLVIKMQPTASGQYQGFFSTTCGSTAKIFYVQRNPQGVWALRTTPYTAFDGIGAVAADSTGTYVVFLNSKDQLLLGKRQSNGAFITQRALGARFDQPLGPSIIAQNGDYWVVWNDEFPRSNGSVRGGLWETKTIGQHVTEGPVGKTYHDDGYLIRRSNGSYQLLTYDELTPGEPHGIPGYGRISVSDRAGTGWTGARTVLGDNVLSGGLLEYADFGGRLYAAAPVVCPDGTANAGARRAGVASQQGSGFARTELDPASGESCDGAPATSAIGDAYLLKLGSSIWVSDNTLAWKSNSSGVFSSAPTEQLAAPPSGTVPKDLLYRSGHIVRVFSKNGPSGATLLEQISD